MKPYVDHCPVCKAKIKSHEEELRHAYLHVKGERKTNNINFRIQPSRHRALKTVAREFNLTTSEAISHAIEETWNV